MPKTFSNLNLPEFDIKIKNIEDKPFVFDIIRKKFICLTPEEWVRQNFLHYLVFEKNYPASLISIEHFLIINKFSRRCDIVVFDNSAKPLVIVECKAPAIKISQQTFDQASGYDLKLNVSYLILTNGMKHYCCKMDKENNSITIMDTIPSYKDLIYS